VIDDSQAKMILPWRHHHEKEMVERTWHGKRPKEEEQTKGKGAVAYHVDNFAKEEPRQWGEDKNKEQGSESIQVQVK
jgi:hypothetical protein